MVVILKSEICIRVRNGPSHIVKINGVAAARAIAWKEYVVDVSALAL